MSREGRRCARASCGCANHARRKMARAPARGLCGRLREHAIAVTRQVLHDKPQRLLAAAIAAEPKWQHHALTRLQDERHRRRAVAVAHHRAPESPGAPDRARDRCAAFGRWLRFWRRGLRGHAGRVADRQDCACRSNNEPCQRASEKDVTSWRAATIHEQ